MPEGPNELRAISKGNAGDSCWDSCARTPELTDSSRRPSRLPASAPKPTRRHRRWGLGSQEQARRVVPHFGKSAHGKFHSLAGCGGFGYGFPQFRPANDA